MRSKGAYNWPAHTVGKLFGMNLTLPDWCMDFRCRSQEAVPRLHGPQHLTPSSPSTVPSHPQSPHPHQLWSHVDRPGGIQLDQRDYWDDAASWCKHRSGHCLQTLCGFSIHAFTWAACFTCSTFS